MPFFPIGGQGPDVTDELCPSSTPQMAPRRESRRSSRVAIAPTGSTAHANNGCDTVIGLDEFPKTRPVPLANGLLSEFEPGFSETELSPCKGSIGFSAPALPHVRLKTPPRLFPSGGILQDTPKVLHQSFEESSSTRDRISLSVDPLATDRSRPSSYEWSVRTGVANEDCEPSQGLHPLFDMLYNALKPGYPNNFKLDQQETPEHYNVSTHLLSEHSFQLDQVLLVSSSGTDKLPEYHDNAVPQFGGDSSDTKCKGSLQQEDLVTVPSAQLRPASQTPATEVDGSQPRAQIPGSKQQSNLESESYDAIKRAQMSFHSLRAARRSAFREKCFRAEVNKLDPELASLQAMHLKPTIQNFGRAALQKLEAEMGCWTCKLRRKKCDNKKPSCLLCKRLGIHCMGYDGSTPDFMTDPEINKALRAEITRLIRQNRRSSSLKKPRR